MLTCREITELATEFAEGHLPEAARREFVAHLAGCHGCATWVGQLETTAKVLGALPPPPPLPAALQAALAAQFEGWARSGGAPLPASAPPAAARTAPRRRGRLALAPAVAVVVAFGLLVAMARRPSEASTDWALAAGLLAVAVALVVRWQRVTLGFAGTAAGAALLAAVATGGGGPFDGAGGLHCLLTVGGTAVLAAGAGWALLRQQPAAVLGGAMGAWAGAGALAAVAALQVACGDRSALTHLLAFHVGGLLLVLLAAAAAARALAPPARA